MVEFFQSDLFHSINAYIALAATLLNLAFAILVMVRTSRTVVYLTFALLCLSAMLWNFGDFMVFATGHRLWTPAEEGASIWKYISSIGSALAPAFMFHFINALVAKERKNRFWINIAYTLSFVIAFSAPLERAHPLAQRIVGGIAWNVTFLILLFPFLVWGIVLVVQGIGRAESEEEKGPLMYFLWAAVIAIIAGSTDLVQKLKAPVPPLGHIGSVIFPSILAIGVFKHRRAHDVLEQTRIRLDMLSEMAAGIAHEIRNPLSSIKGASDLLADMLKHLENPKIREHYGIIAEEIDRLNNILTTFQDFTKPIKLEREPILVNEVLEKTVKLAEADSLPATIRLDLSGEVALINADPSLLKQVFINLIKNGREACGPEGELVIKTEPLPPWVVVTFSDNGPGIPSEIIDRIFEPFFTTKPSGLGVGLSICQRIMEAHNGRIEVNSLLPEGTEFALFLPA